jgi:hypothetical protein
MFGGGEKWRELITDVSAVQVNEQYPQTLDNSALSNS